MIDYTHYVHAFLSLLFVLGLLFLISWGLKRFGWAGIDVPRVKGARRLGISESLNLDARRRLILVKRDQVEHLVLLGPNGEIVIETMIKEAS